MILHIGFLNEKYSYTFKKNSSFLARYNYEFANIDYQINTNNLGLRDSFSEI